MADNFSALRTSRGAPSLFEQVKTSSQISDEARYQLTDADESELAKGLRTGAAGLTAGAHAGEALSAERNADPEWQASRDRALEVHNEAQAYAPRVSSLRDIGSLEDAGDFAAGTFGQGAMSMAPTLAAALLTRGRGKFASVPSFVGGAATAYGLERGEAALGQYADPELAATDVVERDRAASVKGAINAGLESIVPAGIAGSMLRKPAASFLAGVEHNAASEGLTEGLQQLTGMASEHYLDENRSFDPMDALDAVASGVITGGGVSAAATAPAGAVGMLPEMPAAAPAPEAAPPEVTNPLAPTTADLAERDMVPETEDPEILSATNPEEALVKRDAERAENAAKYAEEILADDTTPEVLRQQVMEMQGDYANPENQKILSSALAGRSVGKKVMDTIDSATEFFENFMRGVEDGKSKKMNLQSVELTPETAPLVSLLAQKLGDRKAEAPRLAQQLLALSTRLDPKGELTDAATKRLRNLSDAVGDDVIKVLGETSGNPALSRSLERIREITMARQDVTRSRGNSFLESLLTKKVSAPELRRITDYVDDNYNIADHTGARLSELLEPLKPYFGNAKNAQTVLEYYGNLRRKAVGEEAPGPDDRPGTAEAPSESSLFNTARGAQDVAEQLRAQREAEAADLQREDDPYEGDLPSDGVASVAEFGALREQDEPGKRYGFREAKSQRPFRKFVGEKLSDGRTRREGMRALVDEAGKGADGQRLVSYREFVKSEGLTPETAVKQMKDDIKKRLKEHMARKGEDRSLQINVLTGELAVIDKLEKEGGADAVLDQYEVLEQFKRGNAEEIADDKMLTEMGTLNRSREGAGDTTVEFERTDGTTLKLSAESMWKTRSKARRESGKVVSPQQEDIKQMFLDAAASVLARDDIAGVKTDLSATSELVLKRDTVKPETLGRKPKRADRLKALKELKDDLAEKGKGVPARRKFLKEQEDLFTEDLAEDIDGSEAFEETRAKWEAEVGKLVERAKDTIEKTKKVVDEAWEVYHGGTTNKRAAYAAAEQAQARLDYAKEALKDFEGLKKTLGDTVHELLNERADAEKSGAVEPDGDREGPIYRSEGEVRGPKKQSTYTDAVLASNPELLTVLDSYGDPKDSKWSEAQIRERVYNAYAGIRTTPLRARQEKLRDQYAAAKKAGDKQAMKALEYIGTQIKAVLERRANASPDGPTAQDRGRREEAGKKSALNPKKGRAAPLDKKALIEEIRRIRGKKIAVAFKKFSEIGGSGSYEISDDKTKRIITIAVNAANPMGVAWHESLHDFFAMLSEDKVGRSIKKDLIDAAEAPQVKTKLRELLKGHPEALKQIETSPEERVAYLYQFWAEGLITLGPSSEGLFGRLRRFFNDVLHMVGAEQRAEDLLTALHEGKFADPSTVAEVLADMPSDRFQNKMRRASPVLTETLTKLFDAAPDRLRSYQNDKITELADMFSSERGKLGFIQNRFRQQGVWENKLAGILADTTAQQRRAAMDNLQSMQAPSTKLEKDLAEFFREMHAYMTKAGVKTFDSKQKKWVPLRQVKNYFPRQFDRAALLNDRAGFIDLLKKHGNMSVKHANALIDALVHGTGQLDLVENEHSLGYTPFAAAVADRQLTFIDASNAADFAKYQSKDLTDLTAGYVKQAVHRAEYARTFGNDGEVIAAKIAESGIRDTKELDDIGKVVQGLEGSLGNDMSSATKELMSGVMTLQNLVVLPLAIFSQMIDPIVLAARSGDLKDAGNAYVTAIKRLTGKPVEGEDLADMMGIVAQDSVLEAMGAAYGTTHMSKTARNINRAFFKYNGMQGWNNSMRIAATVAGEKYLIANKSDEKALDELGLTSKDIKVDANGRLDVSSEKVQQAMFRFVDQAVIRPSASNRPVWMSDPRFLLLAHLKQFTFAMHNVVLKRATAELLDGNPKPWQVLMLAMPAILAADMAKFALTGAPPSWGFKDYLVHAVERSGLLGLGDFGVQGLQGIERGKLPGEGLLGPSFEHLMEILRWVGGDPQTSVGDVVDRTVPGARLI